MIKLCSHCLLPSSKPDLYFDKDGVCSACTAYFERPTIDWDKRRAEFLKILDNYRRNDGSWDCLIAVSGGKDSTYQVIKMLELGMNPLCVTATTCDESALGRKNIENIQNLGVDHLQFSPNPAVRKKLNKLGLTEVGDISWPEHAGIFTIPFKVASKFGVGLIVYGENSQNEYGGPDAAAKSTVIDRRWLEEFGGLLGLRVNDLSETYGIAKKNLIPYQYPTSSELTENRVHAIFLGQFFPWDGFENYQVAAQSGFLPHTEWVEGSVGSYENLDNYQTGIHDYFKYLKFGFGRATDIASLHIRRGRMTRNEAIQIVKDRDGKYPWFYLGKPLKQILSPLEMSVEEFDSVCDRFTNRQLFATDSHGELVKDQNSNLQKREDWLV
jgi:N-acetyl sugar amidotransferase